MSIRLLTLATAAASTVAALCSGMVAPASAMPNMPHLFADHEVARCGGDVAHASKHRNSSRGYSGDAAGCYDYRPSSPWPQAKITLRQGARVVHKSWQE